jgi:hypothetical protein
MKAKSLAMGLFLCSSLLIAQESVGTNYTLPVYDGSNEYLTMRQMNQLYQSAFSIIATQVYENYNKWCTFGVYLVSVLIGETITHEEAHRSILTAQKIGAISQPIINTKLSAYVKGVSDSTLQNLRDTDLPMFIRLHTAGIESDYINMQQAHKRIVFDPSLINYTHSDDGMIFTPIFFEYLFRSINVTNYLVSGIKDDWQSKANKRTSTTGFTEEENELDRDIVGHDVYGMIHHLFNPTVEYHRYWGFEDLSKEEQAFSCRLGWRSLINFISPIYVTPGFQLSDSLMISGNAGYCITPFGDFLNENFYIQFEKFNITAYARQFENRKTWFPAFGISLYQYKPFNWLTFSLGGHFWMEPEHLDFNNSNGIPGGAIEGEAQFVLPNAESSDLKGVGFSLGALYKTYGFMPEIEQHDSHFRLSTGLVLRY